MAKKFRGAELVREIDDALDRGLARFLILTQGKLAKSAPIDTGRLASSWFIGAGVPNRDVPPEQGTPSTYRDGVKVKQGTAGPIETAKPDFRITMDRDYFISSNLDYSERVCFDPKYAKGGRRGGAAWFTNIAANLNKDAEKAFDFFLRKVK
tara:strand:- start:482 stop:937 length:456 start_codon:yes stop_codon:yes gene_type:complete